MSHVFRHANLITHRRQPVFLLAGSLPLYILTGNNILSTVFRNICWIPLSDFGKSQGKKEYILDCVNLSGRILEFSQRGWLHIVGNAGVVDNTVRIYISGGISFSLGFWASHSWSYISQDLKKPKVYASLSLCWCHFLLKGTRACNPLILLRQQPELTSTEISSVRREDAGGNKWAWLKDRALWGEMSSLGNAFFFFS